MSGLTPFLKPYRGRIALALIFLILAALTTLVMPIALRTLIDQGFVSNDPAERVMALRGHFWPLWRGVALGIFSASRYYCVTWLGERITSDLKQAVYGHVLKQSPEFLKPPAQAKCSRLTADTTLIQTVVGSSLSGPTQLHHGPGALVMLVITNPYIMAQVIGVLVLVVLPAILYGPARAQAVSRQPGPSGRLQRPGRRSAQRHSRGAKLRAEQREAQRFNDATAAAFRTGVRRIRARAALVAFIISAVTGALLFGLYQARRRS